MLNIFTLNMKLFVHILWIIMLLPHTVMAQYTQVPSKQPESYIVVESHSGKVFYAENSELQRPVASLTKVASAKLVLDWSKASNTDLNQRFVVPFSIQSINGRNPLSLKPGDSLSLRDALYCALLNSDNHASEALADHIGRSLISRRGDKTLPVQTFVNEMNQLAASIGMTKTKFINPHGLEESTRVGKSTASDMGRLAMHVMKDPAFTFFVRQKERKVTVYRQDGTHNTYTLKNTNTLLGTSGVNGIKTGTTAAAGMCLMTSAAKNPIVKKVTTVEGKEQTQLYKRNLVIVLLGSNDRNKRTTQLIKLGWASYDQWYAQGLPLSTTGKELLKLPK